MCGGNKKVIDYFLKYVKGSFARGARHMSC